MTARAAHDNVTTLHWNTRCDAIFTSKNYLRIKVLITVISNSFQIQSNNFGTNQCSETIKSQSESHHSRAEPNVNWITNSS